ncbi:hypothetical protein Tco_1359900 [Tanacetum coccineum]
MDSEEQHNAAEVLVSISRPRGLSIPGPITFSTFNSQIKVLDSKDKGKGIWLKNLKKKKLNSSTNSEPLETTNDEEVARKIQAEWDAEEERKEMKELYDKVQASIKDSFKDFIPMDSEKERETLKEREAKRLLRKRKGIHYLKIRPSKEA